MTVIALAFLVISLESLGSRCMVISPAARYSTSSIALSGYSEPSIDFSSSGLADPAVFRQTALFYREGPTLLRGQPSL